MSQEQDLGLGLLLKFAFPQIEGVGPKWPKAKDFLIPEQGNTAWLEKGAGAVASQIQEAIKSGTPTLIDSRNGHPPFAVIQGTKLYQVQFTESFISAQKEGQAAFFSH